MRGHGSEVDGPFVRCRCIDCEMHGCGSTGYFTAEEFAQHATGPGQKLDGDPLKELIRVTLPGESESGSGAGTCSVSLMEWLRREGAKLGASIVPRTFCIYWFDMPSERAGEFGRWYPMRVVSYDDLTGKHSIAYIGDEFASESLWLGSQLLHSGPNPPSSFHEARPLTGPRLPLGTASRGPSPGPSRANSGASEGAVFQESESCSYEGGRRGRSVGVKWGLNSTSRSDGSQQQAAAIVATCWSQAALEQHEATAGPLYTWGDTYARKGMEVQGARESNLEGANRVRAGSIVLLVVEGPNGTRSRPVLVGWGRLAGTARRRRGPSHYDEEHSRMSAVIKRIQMLRSHMPVGKKRFGEDVWSVLDRAVADPNRSHIFCCFPQESDQRDLRRYFEQSVLPAGKAQTEHRQQRGTKRSRSPDIDSIIEELRTELQPHAFPPPLLHPPAPPGVPVSFHQTMMSQAASFAAQHLHQPWATTQQLQVMTQQLQRMTQQHGEALSARPAAQIQAPRVEAEWQRAQAELEADCERVRAERNRAQAARDRARLECKDVNDLLAKEQTRYRKVADELSNCRAELKAARAVRERRRAEDSAAVLKELTEDREPTQLREQLEQARVEQDAERQAVTAAEKVIAEGRSKIEVLTGQLKTAQLELEEGRARVEALSGDLKGARAELEAAQLRLESRRELMERMMKEMAGEADALRAERDSARAERDSLRVELDATRAKLEAAQQLSGDAATAEHERTAASVERNETRAKLKAAEYEPDGREQKLAAELDATRGELDATRAKLKTVEHARDAAEQKLDDVIAQLEASRAQHTSALELAKAAEAALRGKLEASELQSLRVQSELLLAVRQHESAQAELTSAVAGLEATRAGLEASATARSSDLAQALDQLQQVQAKAGKLAAHRARASLASAQKELSRTGSASHGLGKSDSGNAELNLARAELRNVRARLAAAEARGEMLEGELNSTRAQLAAAEAACSAVEGRLESALADKASMEAQLASQELQQAALARQKIKMEPR